MEQQAILNPGSIERKELLSTKKFIILSLMTFNLYTLWWTYKSWRFFQEREASDINPAARTVFSVFFLYSLFERIRRFAASSGYEKGYSSGLLFTCVLLLCYCSYLPEPFLLIALLSFACYVPAVRALSFGIERSGEYDAQEQRGFNTRQTVLLVTGGVFWALFLTGLLLS